MAVMGKNTGETDFTIGSSMVLYVIVFDSTGSKNDCNRSSTNNVVSGRRFLKIFASLNTRAVL